MKKFSNLSYNFFIATEAILQNKLRAILTSLGIICGVASVIAMLAIGKGAEQEILEKMKILGANNIIVKIKEQKENETATEKEESGSNESENEKINKKKFSPGLSLEDAEALKQFVPGVKSVSPEVIMQTSAMQGGFRKDVQLVGITPLYFESNQFDLAEGTYFTKVHSENSMPVCIIAWSVRTKLFPGERALDKTIKVGNQWLRVVGVLKEKSLTKENIKSLGIRDYNLDIYIPATSMLLRYINRSLVTKQDLNSGGGRGGNKEKTIQNFNQLDRIVITLNDNKTIVKTADVVKRMLLRRHNQVEDFEMIVPEQLLEQEQSTKKIFNFVLGAIASISLLVGGIGIMNIMLASVLERTKEIGIRRAIGAKQNDILMQFLSEAVAISLSGGLIGIFAGVATSLLIEGATNIHTIISPFSVFLSFFVSISVGLVFGITPARRASLQDPIDLLRYE